MAIFLVRSHTFSVSTTSLTRRTIELATMALQEYDKLSKIAQQAWKAGL